MIADLKPYPKMKASGVQWLGAVPSHWTLLPGRACYREKKVPNKGLTETTVLSLSYGHIVVKPPEKLHGLVPASFETYQIVEPGDIIVRPIDLQNDWNSLRFGLSRDRGVITSAYICLCTKEVATRPYGYFLLHTYDLKKVFYGLGSGLRQNLDWTDFKHLPCIVPPLTEQTAIVRFLDHADKRIRRYIRAKQKLIALLEEQKQTTIHQAVTGQIDVRTGQPYPAYKDSGVEWLGNVPEHWEIVRLKVVLSRSTQNGLFKKKSEFGDGAPLINVSDIYSERFQIDPASLEQVRASPEEIQRFRVQSGDIFFVRSSLKLEGTGRSAVAIGCSLDTVFECHLVQARPDRRRVNAHYLIVQLNSNATRHHLISQANVVTMATVAQNVISTCPVLVPPLREQEKLVDWIHIQWNSIALAIDQSIREIDLLREYRTRLIADVVTGKLDVRKAVARLPDETETSQAMDRPDAHPLSTRT